MPTPPPPAHWVARYPDLMGKTAVVAGDDDPLLGHIVGALAGAGCHLAVVAARRDVVDRASEPARAAGVGLHAVAADPGDAAVWQRVLPHVEQRLGPLDIAVAVGSAAAVLLEAVAPDMTARGRGVTILAGEGPTSPAAPRWRQVTGGAPDAAAAAVLWCASDTLAAARATVQLA